MVSKNDFIVFRKIFVEIDLINFYFFSYFHLKLIKTGKDCKQYHFLLFLFKQSKDCIKVDKNEYHILLDKINQLIVCTLQ